MLIAEGSRPRTNVNRPPRSMAPDVLHRGLAFPTPVRRFAMPSGLDVVPVLATVDFFAIAAASVLTSLSLQSSVLMLVLLFTLNAVGGHYRPRLAPALLDEVPSLAARALVAGALVTTLRTFVGWPVATGPLEMAALFLALACVGRAASYPLIRRNRVVGRVARPTIIVGWGQVGNNIALTLSAHPEYGLQPVGFVDNSPLVSVQDRSVPLLGSTAALPSVLGERRIRAVIVAFSNSREAQVVDILRACDRMACEIFLVPRLFELHSSGRDTENVWGVPLTRLRRAPFRTVGWRLKRVFDAMLASIGLLLLSPVMAACAFAVRLETGRGVIFRQQRVGLDGRPFTILKFRTLKPHDETESASRWSITGDPNLGHVGRLLRSTSLDELPQLWNVLCGDMSLVGPRPERQHFVDQFALRFPRYMARHRVPAGLTGWAQVNGLRGDTDISDRAIFDNYYIENWSLWEDVKILLRTVGQTLGGRGQ